MTHDQAPGGPSLDDQIEHGTYRGYQWHRRYDVRTCDACRAAATAYMRDWRARSDNKRAGAYQAARGRALTQLAHRHRAEFLSLLTQYLDEQGTQP